MEPGKSGKKNLKQFCLPLFLEEGQAEETSPTDSDIKPPTVEDNFQPHQEKAKKRRKSLPPRFKYNERESIILYKHDG